ncbi:MAG: phosphatase PAP2 family protein [Acidobacteria bacterium]|nr:MAG: phosphatase PAP2 family protein [Acidobacteriota bacterium]
MRRLLFSRAMTSFWVAAALAAALNQSPAAPAAASPPNPFRQLFHNLGTDAKSLASVNSLVIMGVGGAGAIATKNNADIRAHDWAVKQPKDPGLAQFGNVAGDGFLQGGLAVATWAIGRQQQNVRLETTGSDLIRAQVLNGILTQAIKLTVNRERPDGGGHAFPSGHASATFATAAVIQRDYGFAAALPFYGLGGLVSWSRVRTSHHWVSDVVFGGALGITSGLAVTKGRPGKWSVTPVKTSGGAAIYFTRR